jgi:riboflavin kinase / FMN adenylyltransferase
VEKLREEVRFDSLEALIAQMDRDALAARSVLGIG